MNNTYVIKKKKKSNRNSHCVQGLVICIDCIDCIDRIDCIVGIDSLITTGNNPADWSICGWYQYYPAITPSATFDNVGVGGAVAVIIIY